MGLRDEDWPEDSDEASVPRGKMVVLIVCHPGGLASDRLVCIVDSADLLLDNVGFLVDFSASIPR